MPLYRSASVTDATLSFSDITTNNASTSKHGFLLKLDNDTSHYLRGDGTWATTSGGSADYTKLDESIVGAGGVASFDFTSISQLYRDLRIVCSVQSEGASTNYNAHMIFNNDSTANHYDYVDTGGGGSGGDTKIVIGIVTGSAHSTDYSWLYIDIPNYTQSTFYTMCRGEYGYISHGTTSGWGIQKGGWLQTAAINRVTITNAGGDWAQGSVATLYGIGLL